MTEAIISAQDERKIRNELYAEIGEHMIRIGYTCSENPHGDIPEPGADAPFAHILADPKYRPKPVNMYSRHWFTFNGIGQAAVVYEQRQRGTGYYARIRTVRELDEDVAISDYAIKTTSPDRSINWMDVWLSKATGQLVSRSDKKKPTYLESVHEGVMSMGLRGTDLEPGHFHPQTPEDYEKARTQLIRVAAIAGNLSTATVVRDLQDYPAPLQRYIANPFPYSPRGPRIYYSRTSGLS